MTNAAPASVLLLALGVILAACGRAPESSASAGGDAREGVEGPRLVGRPAEVTSPPPVVASPPPLADLPPNPISGRTKPVQVVDAHGRPVKGARVRRLWGGADDGARTDARGIALTGPFLGGHGTPTQCRRSRTIVVEAEGYAPHPHLCESYDDGEEVVTLRTRGLRLEGSCRTQDGAGIPRARLELRCGDASFRFHADDTGHFATLAAPPRRATLAAHTDGFIAAAVSVVPPDDDVRVVFYRPARLRGQLDVPPARRRSALRRLRLEPEAHAIDVDEETLRFEVTALPGESTLWSGSALIGTYSLAEGEVRDLGVVEPAPVVARRERSADVSRPIVHLDFGDLGLAYVHVSGWFLEGGLRHLDYVDKKKARVELPQSDLAWLAFTTPGGAACWRQVATGVQALRLEMPPLSPFTVGALRDERGLVHRGDLALRWAGTSDYALTIGEGPYPPGPRSERRGAGPGTYDLVWKRSHHEETVVLRRGIVVPPGDDPVALGDLSVPPPVTLCVHVEDADGTALEGVPVTLSRPRRTLALRTDDGGRACFELSDPTQITLFAEVPGRGKATRSLASADDGGVVVLRLE